MSFTVSLLGGPQDGREFSVPDPPPPHVELGEWVKGEPAAPLDISGWARVWGIDLPRWGAEVSPRTLDAYRVYRRWMAAGRPRHRSTLYRKVFWGSPWRLHYVHPDHVAAPLAEAL